MALLPHPESLPRGSARAVRVGGWPAHAPDAVESVRHAGTAAMTDVLVRATAQFSCPTRPAEGWNDSLLVVLPLDSGRPFLRGADGEARWFWDNFARPHTA